MTPTDPTDHREGPRVTEKSTLPVEPWCVRETRLDLSQLGRTESLFALSNGHIGLRGNLDEGEPHDIPGTYLGSFFEQRPLPYAEAGYGYPESGQTVVNVTNGKLMRLLVDDESFDVRYGELLSHERTLDLRDGTLEREAEWVSPAGNRVQVRTTRLVSFAQRGIAAIAYEVESLEREARVVLQSELVANEAPPPSSADPRVAAALEAPLVAVDQDSQQDGALLVHRTRASGLLVAAAMTHTVEAPGRVHVETDVREDWARTTVITVLRPGERLRVVKLLSYGWSGTRSAPAVRDQVAAGLAGARYTGWGELVRSQREYLDAFWDTADVEVHGDPVVQQAVRFGLFHVLQSGARAERRAIASKGLTGPGYDGHAFWDTEGFVLPVLTLTAPKAAADALRWRQATLDEARRRAQTLGLPGATFPWRTIDGRECSAYWPAGTAAFHINADIAYAVEQYRLATGDDAFEAEVGLELLVETARLWRGLGHHDVHGAWHVDGVTGPDEYTAMVDDNVFTNLMAARNLLAAAEACARHPRAAAAMGVTHDETAAWRTAAEAVCVPYDEHLGVHPQSEDFTRYAEWDFEAYRGRRPLMMHAPYVRLYRAQVLKQADLVLAMHWVGDAFTPEQKARNVDYYERRTLRDSSLSACTQAVLCAEVGHLDLAHDYTHEAALVDLRDLHSNTGDGLHMASLAGAWTALVAGFGGLRIARDGLRLAPQLPSDVSLLAFRLEWRGTRLVVEVTAEQVVCSVPSGCTGGVELTLYDEPVEVTADSPVTRPVQQVQPLLPPPTQPPGRAPVTRVPNGG